MVNYDDIISAVKKEIPELRDAVFDIQPTPENQPGDLGLACFRFSNVLRQAPPVIAAKIADISFSPIFSSVQATGPYVNFTLDRSAFAAELIGNIFTKGESFGSNGTGKGQKVILEHTSINPNASPHIGRARNGLIGDAVARLLRFEEYDVNVHYYVNDMGKQIGLLMLQTEGMETLEFHQVLDLYVEANKRAKDDPEFEQKGLELLSKMEQGDPGVAAGFDRIVSICLNGQLGVLGRLYLTYDTFDKESAFLDSPRMKEVLDVLDRNDALFTDDQGRKVVDLQPLGYPVEEGRYVVLVRANGSSMYFYRDIAYTLEKLSRGGDLNMIVLGEDHKMYFEQMATILRALGKDVPEVIHYSYIVLKEGKMSTRNGTVVLLEDFLDEAIRLARERVDEQCTHLPEEERAEISEMIGIGAVRFTILSVRPNRNVVFDWDSALSFTGDSGPYIQYSCTRIASILRKHGTDPDTFDLPEINITHDAEWSLIFRLSQVAGDIEQALAVKNPGIVATTALDVARKFSVFYTECPVISAPDKITVGTRIALCIATRRVLITLLGLLGIQAPDHM